jgi:hypothetical protein
MSDATSAGNDFQRVILFSAVGDDPSVPPGLRPVTSAVDSNGNPVMPVLLEGAAQSDGGPVPANMVSDVQDAQDPEFQDSALLTAGRSQVFNGSTFDVARGVSAATQLADAATGVPLIAHKASTPKVHAPAVGVQATTNRAAPGAGSCHVITGIQASIGTAAAASGVNRVQLLSAATVVWEQILQCPANDSKDLNVTGLHIVCGVNEAVTLRFSAAPVATAFQTVNLQGYVAPPPAPV